MKNLLFILTIAFTTIGFSQGNLQFNQVLLLDITAPPTSASVPIGKVWKIENAMLTGSNSYAQIQIAGTNYYLMSTAGPFNNLPFWLPGGTSFNLTGPAANTGKLSVIEFNLIP